MYKIVKWSEALDLTDFYNDAASRGFVNNSSQKAMVDCFRNEQEWCVWILYYNDRAVGSVGAHSLSELGPNAYRICARTCVFSNLLPMDHLRSLGFTIKQHQNATAQMFIPTCVDWAPEAADLYITSHPSDVGTQRLVHKIYCPALVETGALEKTCELEYRGHVQTFWKLNVKEFKKQLDNHPRWLYTSS
jgi:hypothetical protein